MTAPTEREAMEELESCPFCGGKAAQVDFDGRDESDPNAGGSLIECTQCQASSPVHFDRKEHLFSSWNERTLKADLRVSELEALLAECEDILEEARVCIDTRDSLYPLIGALLVKLKARTAEEGDA